MDVLFLSRLQFAIATYFHFLFVPLTLGLSMLVAQAGSADVDAAVSAANAAMYGPWASCSPTDRGAVLARIADIVEDRSNRRPHEQRVGNAEYVRIVVRQALH